VLREGLRFGRAAFAARGLARAILITRNHLSKNCLL